MAASAEATWPGAVWVGEVWRDNVDALAQESQASGRPVQCRLNNADGYGRARLLVRSPGRIHGFIELDISDGALNFTDLAQHVARAAGPADPFSAPQRQPRTRSVTVVMCSRNRPHLVPVALEAILAVDFTDFDVIVVDFALDRETVLRLGGFDENLGLAIPPPPRWPPRSSSRAGRPSGGTWVPHRNRWGPAASCCGAWAYGRARRRTRRDALRRTRP